MLLLFDVMVVDYYKRIINYRLKLKDFLSLKPNAKDHLYLVLNKQPAKSDSYKFVVKYMQTLDSRQIVFSMETGEVNIKK